MWVSRSIPSLVPSFFFLSSPSHCVSLDVNHAFSKFDLLPSLPFLYKNPSSTGGFQLADSCFQRESSSSLVTLDHREFPSPYFQKSSSSRLPLFVIGNLSVRKPPYQTLLGHTKRTVVGMHIVKNFLSYTKELKTNKDVKDHKGLGREKIVSSPWI